MNAQAAAGDGADGIRNAVHAWCDEGHAALNFPEGAVPSRAGRDTYAVTEPSPQLAASSADHCVSCNATR